MMRLLRRINECMIDAWYWIMDLVNDLAPLIWLVISAVLFYIAFSGGC